MTPETWQRVKAGLAGAQALTGSARGSYLAGLDADLRAEVESLLRADEQHAGRLEDGACGPTPSIGAGQRLGPYEVTGILGEGGMGVVYRARRADGAFERDVAIKVLRRALLAPQFLERFQRERQILARLEHPAIARLLDGGETADGDPWLAMELIDGPPLDRYCADAALPVPERIRLFRDVCSAVQYAHANLVVHRDLKPRNILIAAGGQPKLLDFGIARLLDEGGAEETRHTALPVMTLEYASPEQLRGERVTTASDVYSLGVILYGLLTGRPPYRLRDATAPELIRAISEGDAQRTGLGADLDAIVFKAMRPRPEDRYATPERLADDLRRYAEGLPVSARTGTRGYLVRKFVRRNALSVGFAAAAVVVLLGGLVVTGVLYTRLRAATRDTTSALAESRAVTEFLEVDLLGAANPRHTGRTELPVRDVLEAASRRVGGRFAHEPLLAAAVHAALGQSWAGAGDMRRADAEYRAALALLDGRTEPRARTLRLETVARMANDHLDDEDLEPARAVLDSVLPFRDAPASDAERDQRLVVRAIDAALRNRRGDPTAIAAIETIIAEARAQVTPSSPLLTRLRDVYASVLGDAGNLEAEEREIRSLLAEAEQRGEPEEGLFSWRENLASVLATRGRPDEALEIARPLYAREKAVLGSADGGTIRAGNIVATALDNLGRRDEAAALYRELLAEAERTRGPDDDQTLAIRGNLAVLYQHEQRWADAADLEARTLEAYHRRGMESTRSAILSLRALARSHAELGRWAEAEREARHARDLAERHLSADDVLQSVIRLDVAAVDLHAGRRAEAVALLEEATPPLLKALGPAHSVTVRLMDLRTAAGLARVSPGG